MHSHRTPLRPFKTTIYLLEYSNTHMHHRKDSYTRLSGKQREGRNIEATRLLRFGGSQRTDFYKSELLC